MREGNLFSLLIHREGGRGEGVPPGQDRQSTPCPWTGQEIPLSPAGQGHLIYRAGSTPPLNRTGGIPPTPPDRTGASLPLDRIGVIPTILPLTEQGYPFPPFPPPPTGQGVSPRQDRYPAPPQDREVPLPWTRQDRCAALAVCL